MRTLVCVVCHHQLHPELPEENAPANADVRAHRRCASLEAR